MPNNDNDKIKDKNPSGFNEKAYRHAISMIESSGGKFLETGINPKTGRHYSSAAGKYHFLYESIKGDPEMKGISKREFMNDDALQERIMDKALAGKLKGYTYGEGYANKLKKEFNSDYDVNGLMALVHFVGAGNARKFLKDPQGFRVPGAKNLTGDQYLEKFKKYFKEFNTNNPTDKEASKYSSPERINDERRHAVIQQDNTAVRQPITNKNRPSIIPSSLKGSTSAGYDFIDSSNSFKKGGQMDGLSGAEKLVTMFEGGGSHEQNPNGGIPQGVGANGKPNLVEEGETKWNDYIFSNAIDMDGNFTGEDGNKINVFEDGGELTTGGKEKEKVESGTDPAKEFGPQGTEGDKYPLKFTKTQSVFHKKGRDIEVNDIRDKYIGNQIPFTPIENDRVNFERTVKDEQGQSFLDRYNNDWSREKMQEQTGLTNYDIDNMILRGLEAEKEVGNNVRGSKASYDHDDHKISMGVEHKDDAGVETHERVHASGFDAAQGKNLLNTLGSAFQQEGRSFLKKMSPDTLRYLGQPHEAYGNFVEFREKLGLKPGEKISPEELKAKVKKKGLGMENFYRAFNDENISKALNTIAYQDSTETEDTYRLS